MTASYDPSEPLAPLASMEDLSVWGTPFTTPMPTPGASPRTRARWSHRSSTGSQYSNEPMLVNQDPGYPVTSTPNNNTKAKPPPPDVPPRRFVSPARTQNTLLRKQVVLNNNGNMGPVYPVYPPAVAVVPDVPSGGAPQRNYSRARPPSMGFMRSCDPIAESPAESSVGFPPVTATITTSSNGVYPNNRRPRPRRAWKASDVHGQEESARILDPEKDEILMKPRQVQFITPRKPTPDSHHTIGSSHSGGSNDGSSHVPVVGPNGGPPGYRVGATEEFVFGGEGIPRDR